MRFCKRCKEICEPVSGKCPVCGYIGSYVKEQCEELAPRSNNLPGVER